MRFTNSLLLEIGATTKQMKMTSFLTPLRIISKFSEAGNNSVLRMPLTFGNSQNPILRKKCMLDKLKMVQKTYLWLLLNNP
jgi:hypothetical protein